jgi:hypothetical protein
MRGRARARGNSLAVLFLAAVLFSCSAKDNQAFSYVDRSDVQGMQQALGKGLSPNLFDSHGKTLLFYAVERKNRDMVELLLENKADPNIETTEGRSCLFEAYSKYSGKLSLSLIALLLDHRADVNHPQGGAPLIFQAVETCNLELTSLLLDHGASPNIADATGHYPVQVIGGPFECDPTIGKQIEKLLVTHGSKTLESLRGAK